ncbi:MAG: hypothetical protein PWR10_1076 [Halanaerobiales bacterium]|nr:hypothetical protein [Halanaerobiales bacterium]
MVSPTIACAAWFLPTVRGVNELSGMILPLGEYTGAEPQGGVPY